MTVFQNVRFCLFIEIIFISLISVDHTRVVLKDGDPDQAGSDYINANLIEVRNCRIMVHDFGLACRANVGLCCSGRASWPPVPLSVQIPAML